MFHHQNNSSERLWGRLRHVKEMELCVDDVARRCRFDRHHCCSVVCETAKVDEKQRCVEPRVLGSKFILSVCSDHLVYNWRDAK